MWADNETNVDLLGFQVHTDLIKSVVTDTSLLPITIGVFGDWGSGKSSVMKILEQGLQENEKVVTIYFNGWQFEGYDDAKSALIYSILIELAEHRRLAPKIKSRAIQLIKKVDWVRVASTSYQVALPFLAALASAQAGIPIMPVQSPQTPLPSTPVTPQKQLVSDLADVDLTELLKSNPANQAMMGAREFRKEFSSLIADTNLEAVIILVDDLDRCEPKRLVETLEAIKLFLTVPHVAFVISADERIVRHAIAKRYETEDVTQDILATERQTDLITDYVEKLIQIPYHLPRLSQSEIETYMSLLFCSQHLKKDFETIYQVFKTSRSKDITNTFSLQQIQEAAATNNIDLPDTLIQELNWCTIIAPSLCDFLKGNPRQTKRLLNALILRRKLAEAAHLEDLSERVLVKLMLLQYLRPRLFAQLYKWQASQNGLPQEVNDLEEWAKGNEAEVPEAIEQGVNWNYPTLRRWLSMDPSLANVDLRSYFWITRDRIEGILSGVSAVPKHMRQIILDLVGLEANGIFPNELKEQIAKLPTDEQNILLDEMEEKLKRAEEKRNLIWVWDKMLPIIPSVAERLIEILSSIPSSNLPSPIPAKVSAIAAEYPAVKKKATELLQKWASEPKGTIARASKEMLVQAKEGNN